MLSYSSAIILGALQGITELFPVSSLGHSVILPRILHLNINQKDPIFLTFLVATHAATALVLFVFFWRDWQHIISGLGRSLYLREIRASDTYARLAWLLIIATIPAGILGLLFEEPLKSLFASPQLVAAVLIINGCMLALATKLTTNNHIDTASGGDVRIGKLRWLDSLVVGLMQCIALIPGFSRTGAAITGGVLTGLSSEDAARFSFLLATPIIGAAALLKLPDLLGPAEIKNAGPLIAGAVTAGVFAYLSVKFLMQYFETKKLTPFAIYCIVIGSIVSILLIVI